MPMPIALSAPDRIVLAPVNTNVSLPVRIGKATPRLRNCSFPLTPSHTPRPFLPKSASMLAKSYSTAENSSALSGYKITNNRNVRADSAATKLKLRLQLAFYKLQQRREASVAFTPRIRIPSSTSLLKDCTTSFTLKEAPIKATRFLSLNTVASQKTGSMHLFRIKNTSSYHNAFPSHLPLRSKSCKLPSVHKMLKTPIKAAAKRQAALVTAASDETIDEVVDETLAEITRNDDILSSSPIRHSSYGTPNSFSVAKSLLLLGLARF